MEYSFVLNSIGTIGITLNKMVDILLNIIGILCLYRGEKSLVSLDNGKDIDIV